MILKQWHAIVYNTTAIKRYPYCWWEFISYAWACHWYLFSYW